MPTDNPRIQVTEDHELSAALRAAAPHLPAGLPRSRQVRELAIVGARHLSGGEPDDVVVPMRSRPVPGCFAIDGREVVGGPLPSGAGLNSHVVAEVDQ